MSSIRCLKYFFFLYPVWPTDMFLACLCKKKNYRLYFRLSTILFMNYLPSVFPCLCLFVLPSVHTSIWGSHEHNISRTAQAWTLVGFLQSYALQRINLLVTGIDPNWVKVTSRSNEPERIGLLAGGGFPINLPSSVQIYLIMIDILIFIHVSMKHYDVWNCSGQGFNNIFQIPGLC